MDFKDYESKEHVFVLFSFSTRYIFWNFVGEKISFGFREQLSNQLLGCFHCLIIHSFKDES